MKFSIMLDESKCVGCTNCMRRCPTQAIRIKNGKAVIDNEKCVHCGECIKACPYQAYSAVGIDISKTKDFKYKIAVPSVTMYGQFPKGTQICKIHDAIMGLGFDFVYDESWAAELVSKAIKQKVNKNKDIKPLISTNCPATLRLIKTRYPSLLEHLISIEAPMEIAAKLARIRIIQTKDIRNSDIGVYYISPCPAKMLSIINPIGLKKSGIDGVIPLKTVYGDLYREVKMKTDHCFSNPSLTGLKWAVSGGQSQAAEIENYIAVHGMENVVNIFEEIENGKLNNIDFVEALACVGGCVGGSLNIENPFVAKNNIIHIVRNTNETLLLNDDLDKFDEFMKSGVFNIEIPYIEENEKNKGKSLTEAVNRMKKIKEIEKLLPNLDCGSCGAPTCHALAEDILNGTATLDNCVVLKANKKED